MIVHAVAFTWTPETRVAAADLDRYLDGPEHEAVQRAWLAGMIARRVSVQLDLGDR